MSRQPPGFTLLEMLVAVTVLGFLLAGIAQDFDFGLRAWSMQARLAGGHEGLDAVSRTLRGLVTRMDAGSADTPPRIDGTASRLSFTTDLPASPTLPRHADVVLAVDEAHRLVLRAAPHVQAASGARPTEPSSTILLDRVDSVRFSFLPPGGSAWTDSWQKPYPPRLVSVHLEFPRGDGRRWPDIVAAPAQGRPRG